MSDITWAQLQEIVATAIARTEPEPVTPVAEVSVLDVLSGEATWDDLDAYRLAG